MYLIRRIAPYVLSSIVTVLLFDIIAYHFLADRIRLLDPKYTRSSRTEPYIHRGYPRYHFEQHGERGFDIAPGVESMAHCPRESEPYPVWGNSLGCFDNEFEPGESKVIYLAGDSSTWGYTPFERKFGTIADRALKGIRLLKCGVSHTGQLHQFSKFKEILEDLGQPPFLVIVNYSSNDILNDWAYPHSTVIDGYQVETVHAIINDDGTVSRQVEDIEVVAERYAAWKKDVERTNLIEFMSGRLQKYSATAVISAAVVDHILSAIRGPRAEDFYRVVPFGEIPIYSDIAGKNRAALQAWNVHASVYGYRLVVSIIPERVHLKEPAMLGDFKEFLSRNNIEYWDPMGSPDQDGFTDDDYWENDNHFNFSGNARYAEFLTRQIENLD